LSLDYFKWFEAELAALCERAQLAATGHPTPRLPEFAGSIRRFRKPESRPKQAQSGYG